MLPSVLLTPCAAPLIADPPEELTLDRPCEAFEVTSEAVSFDFAAVSFAASVVEAFRLVVWRAAKRECRSIKRVGAAVGMKEKDPSIHRLIVPSKDRGNCFEIMRNECQEHKIRAALRKRRRAPRVFRNGIALV